MPQCHIANLLRQAIGVDAATIGQSVIDHAVRARMGACGMREVADYWERLRHSAAELEQLTEAVVVPETWFFRDAETYAALAQIVTNEWLPANLTGGLRILSAPCSTGEEPYSIAMALIDAGLPPHRFKIDAIDISSRALDIARRAIYGRNSFRGRELSFRDRFFRSQEAGYQLADSVLERVEFQHGNLIADDLLPGIGSYDIVFCRNVLIYFDAATQERVHSNARPIAGAGRRAFRRASRGVSHTFKRISFGGFPELFRVPQNPSERRGAAAAVGAA